MPDRVYSGNVSRLDEQLSDTENTLTMSNAFSGRTIASEGWLSVGNAQDFQPASDGSLPEFEEIYYTGYTKEPGTYTGLTVFTGLTRASNTNSTETISQTWSGGTIVGGSLTGDLMSNVPTQDSDLNMGDNSITKQLSAEMENLYLNQKHPKLFYHRPLPATDTKSRTGKGIAVDGKNVYMAGGWVSGSAWSTFNRYEYDNQKINNLTDLPGARNKPTAREINGKIYVAGGASSSTGTYYDTIWEYDPSTDSWTTTLTAMPQAVGYAPGVAYNSKLYVIFGGKSGITYHNKIQIYDPSTDSWTQSSTAPYWGSDCIAGQLTVDGTDYIYIFVGYNEDDFSGYVGELIRYDIASDSWETGFTSYPIDYAAGSGGAMNNILFQVGGHNWDTGDNTKRVFAYVPEVDEWFEQPTFPRIQEATLNAGVINDTTAVISNDYESPLTVLYELSTNELDWINRDYIHAYTTTNQTIENAQWEKVQLDSITEDFYDDFDNSTDYKYVVPETGKYEIEVKALYNDTTQAGSKLQVSARNADDSKIFGATGIYATGSKYEEPRATFPIKLEKGEEVCLWVYHNDGGDVDIMSTNNTTTYMRILKM